MPKPSTRTLIKTSIVTAFTIAAALIWKDVIIEFINIIVPPSEQLLYKFIAAILSTVFVILALYIILETESEAEYVMKKFK